MKGLSSDGVSPSPGPSTALAGISDGGRPHAVSGGLHQAVKFKPPVKRIETPETHAGEDGRQSGSCRCPARFPRRSPAARSGLRYLLRCVPLAIRAALTRFRSKFTATARTGPASSDAQETNVSKHSLSPTALQPISLPARGARDPLTLRCALRWGCRWAGWGCWGPSPACLWGW